MTWKRYNPLRHPPMAAGWIDAPHYSVKLGDLALESGEVLRSLEVSLAVHGDIQDQSLPVALVLCAIGSTHHRLDFLIREANGPERALDPAKILILAVDAIGNGLTTSPSNSTSQPGFSFPRFTIRDMVRTQWLALCELGLEKRLQVVLGASMGGMQALEWAVSYPEAMRAIVAMTPTAKTTAWTATVNEAARNALLSRIDSDGRYAKDVWDAWVPLMQMLVLRTPKQLNTAFTDAVMAHAAIAEQRLWWRKQQFDPIDWIYQSWAYDLHDVGHSSPFAGDTAHALGNIRASTLIVLPELDLYNPVSAGEEAARQIPQCELLRIDSLWGHSCTSVADTLSAHTLTQRIRSFLQRQG